MPEQIVDLPPDYAGSAGLLQIRHEEEAVCWLWAYPHLLPWNRPISWLYTSVVGNDRWPGDLWGVDARGDLLIIECKRGHRSADPFVDFVRYQDHLGPEITGEHWKAKFPSHLRAERAVPDPTAERPAGHTDGILPRSNKRAHIRRWSQLAQRIAQHVRSSAYEGDALARLDARTAAGDPPPYYCALMVRGSPRRQLLSRRGSLSRRTLEGCLGAHHVLAVEILGVTEPGGTVRLSAVRI